MRLPVSLCTLPLALVTALAPNPARATDTADTESSDAVEARDPFVPLVGPSGAPCGADASPDTLAGVRSSDVKLTAIVRTQSGTVVAQVEGGPLRRGYVAHVGDRFCDGTVLAIDPANTSMTVRTRTPDGIRPWRDVVLDFGEDRQPR